MGFLVFKMIVMSLNENNYIINEFLDLSNYTDKELINLPEKILTMILNAKA